MMVKYISNTSLPIILFVLLVGLNKPSLAHCEIPCGIFHDSLRINIILEHITTIEKSMNQIKSLSESKEPNYNQLVRWVTNKETHAEEIQEIVSKYFLHQRIKFVNTENKKAYSKYLKELELLHKISVYAMKSKQGLDLTLIDKLESTVNEFSESYFSGHKH